MRSYVLLPLLALSNMGANAATIHNVNTSTLPKGFRLPGLHNRRQVHNADFSSSTPPPAKGAFTNTEQSASGSSSSSLSGSLDRRGISVDLTSNSAVDSMSVGNGHLAVQARAETGSADADVKRDSLDHAAEARSQGSIGVDDFSFHRRALAANDASVPLQDTTTLVTSRQSVPSNSNVATDLSFTMGEANSHTSFRSKRTVSRQVNDGASRALASPNLSRDINTILSGSNVAKQLAQLDGACSSLPIPQAGKRMLDGEVPGKVPMPDTEGTRKARGVLDSLGSTTGTSSLIRGTPAHLNSFEEGTQVRSWNNDANSLVTPPLPASLPPPLRRDDDLVSPGDHGRVRSRDLDLPVPALAGALPVRRDASVGGAVSRVVNSGVLPGSVPGGFVWKEERL